MMNDDNLTKAEKIEHIKHFISNMRLLLDALEEEIESEDDMVHYMSLYTACELHDWLAPFKRHINTKFQEVRRILENERE